jgi:hypothetical protein
MNTRELSLKIQNLVYHITNDNDGFEYFKMNWGIINKEDEIYLKSSLIKICQNTLFNGDPTTIIFFNSIKILEYFEELNEIIDPCFPLKLNQKITDKEIVKVFKRLQNNKVILDTNKTLAKALSIIFNIKEGTIYSYLSKTGEMNGVDDII